MAGRVSNRDGNEGTIMSTSVLQEIMELPKCVDESGCRWIKADDVYQVIDEHINRLDCLSGWKRLCTICGITYKEEIADEQN